MWKKWITKRIQIIDNLNYVKQFNAMFVKIYTNEDRSLNGPRFTKYYTSTDYFSNSSLMNILTSSGLILKATENSS